MQALLQRPLVRSFNSKRILKRMAGAPKVLEPTPYTGPAPRWQPEPFTLMPSGWAPPTGKVPADCPFKIVRTPSGHLPIYTDMQHARTKLVTVLRLGRVEGDLATLVGEIRAVMAGARVELKQGRIEIEGNAVQQLKSHFSGLGF